MASRFQGVHKQSTGYKMLAALGWKEGEGLGAMKQGITEHVRVKKVHEKTGVGAAEAAVKARDWTLGMVAYDRVLAALNEVTSHHAACRAESDSEDEEERIVSAAEQAAAKAAAKAVRAARKAAKAAAKVSAESAVAAAPAVSDSNLTADGSGVSSKKKRKRVPRRGTEEVSLPQQGTAAFVTAVDAEPEVKRVRQATHAGRFKRREAGKRVRHYSADDLTAILGGRPQGGAASQSDGGEPRDPAERAASPETPSASEPPKPTSSDSPRPEGASGEVEADSSAQLEPAERLWWHGYFVRAGRLAGLQKPKQSAVKGDGNGFREDDQVAAWTAAQDGATKSKQGLGRSEQPRKVGGAQWQGTRTKLGSDDEATQSEVDEDEQQVVVRAPKRAAAAVPAAVPAPVTAPAAAYPPGSGADGVKWKKLARKVLQGQPGGALKLRKLQRLAVASAQLPAGVDRADAASSFEARLRRSTMFVFQGNVVSLAKC